MTREVAVERISIHGTRALIVLAVLASIGAIYLLKPILVPIALALLLTCLLAPVTWLLRRLLPLGQTGASVVLFSMTLVLGLYVASLTAESFVQAMNSLPSDVDHLAGRISGQINDARREHSYLRPILPDSHTIDQLGDANREILIQKLSDGFMDLTSWVVQGLIVLVLLLFLLAESDMLTSKVIRFFAPAPGDAETASRTLDQITRQLRVFLVARTLINLGVGAAFAAALMLMKVKFAIALGLFAAVSNFVPYVGQVLAGALPAVITLGQHESVGDALIVGAIYLAIIGIEGYVVTPYVIGRSFDLNGTTVLIACLFWGFLWGLVGLVLAMPITVSMKLVFQRIPELNRFAELMTYQWQSPEFARFPSPPPPVEFPDPSSGAPIRIPHPSTIEHG
jgi:predicted PurR-regulated permease PerM